MDSFLVMLSEKSAAAAFAVVVDSLLNDLPRGAVVFREAVNAEKLGDVSGNELLIYRYVVRPKRRAAFLAGLVVRHYFMSTSFMRSTRQPWGWTVVQKRSVNLPRFSCF